MSEAEILPPEDRSGVIACRAFYFFYYGAFTCVFPYFALHYEGHGLSGRQIGLLMAIPYLLMPVAAPLFGGLADVLRQARPLLLVLVAGLMAAVFGIWRWPHFHTLLGLVVAYAAFNGPIPPIVDNATLEALGERRRHYGRQRLFGSIAWGSIAPVAGLAIDRYGLGAGFSAFFVLMSCALVAGWRVPVSRLRLDGRYFANVRLFLGNRRWLHFLVAVFFGGLGLSMMNVYLFLHLEHLGASRLLMGFTQTFSTTSEMLVLLFFHRLTRFGPQRIFNVSLGLLVVRLGLLSSITNPLWVLPLQLMHGCTYASMMASGVTYAHVAAPRGLGTTAQGIFAGVFNGIGCAVGTVTGGLLYHAFGTALMFRIDAGLCAFGLVVYLVLGLTVPGMRLALPRERRERRAEP